MEAQKFFDNRHHINPLTYLIAKNEEKFYSKVNISPDNEGAFFLETCAKNYLDSIKNEIAENDSYDWDDDYPDNALLIKNFDNLEFDFYRKRRSFERIDNDDFLKKQYQLRYFNLELPLNEIQSIHLHQYISSSYQSSFKKALIRLNENTERIKVIDFTDSFTIDTYFNFVSYYDKQNFDNCFTVISDLTPFERLYGFIDRYKEAYDEVSKLACLDLSNMTDTEDCWRKCSSLLKFKDRNTYLAALKVNLLAKDKNFPKKFLAEKGIQVIFKKGEPVLMPENPRQLKIIIKILSDKLVNTYLGHKDGLSDHIEVL